MPDKLQLKWREDLARRLGIPFKPVDTPRSAEKVMWQNIARAFNEGHQAYMAERQAWYDAWPTPPPTPGPPTPRDGVVKRSIWGIPLEPEDQQQQQEPAAATSSVSSLPQHQQEHEEQQGQNSLSSLLPHQQELEVQQEHYSLSSLPLQQDNNDEEGQAEQRVQQQEEEEDHPYDVRQWLLVNEMPSSSPSGCPTLDVPALGLPDRSQRLRSKDAQPPLTRHKGSLP